MFEEQRLGNNGTEASRTCKLDDGDNEMKEKDEDIAHSGMVSKPEKTILPNSVIRHGTRKVSPVAVLRPYGMRAIIEWRQKNRRVGRPGRRSAARQDSARGPPSALVSVCPKTTAPIFFQAVESFFAFRLRTCPKSYEYRSKFF